MAKQEKMKKRLLYDLSPIPEPPINEGVTGKLDPEVRIVFKKTQLQECIILRKGYKVGTAYKDVDLMLDDSFSENSYELVSLSGDSTTLNIKDDFKGYVVENKVKREFSQLGKNSFEITKENFAVVEFGTTSVVVMKSPAEKMRRGSFYENLDVGLVITFLLVCIVGLITITLITETPPIEVDIFEMDNRFAKLIVEAPEEDIKVDKEEKEKKVKLEKPKEGIAEATQQRKSLGEEGRVGNKNSRVANAQGSARRGLDEKVAQSSGIMGALSSGAASFDRVFGGGGLGAGMDKTLGSVTGISGVDQFGSGGLGTRGFGTGGGGNALGIGGLGTRGRGGGGAGGYGAAGSYGMGEGRIGGKGLSNISAGGGQAVIMGALDRAVIDAYIRRNLAKIRWCYEKELNKDPKIFGKIVINFIISKDGAVSSSKVNRTTMGNENVESCVADQIKKIRFPAPKGGGIVIVNYPFVFKNSEG